MTAYELASTIVAVLGLIGGGIGFVRSLVAGRAAAEAAARAADAQADATVALQKSAAADQRIAAALEAIAAHQGAAPHRTSTEHPIDDLAAELRALVPPADVRWQVEPRLEAGTIRLRNVGSLDATRVGVDGATIDASFKPIGASIAVGDAVVVRLSGSPESIEVTWHDAQSPDPQHERITVRHVPST